MKKILNKINSFSLSFLTFIFLILFFAPIKNSLAETNYSFTSTDSYYTIVAGYETYKIEYTPSSNITFKIGTYSSPVDTFINVFPKATANLSSNPRQSQTGSTSNDDGQINFNAAFTQDLVSCYNNPNHPHLCSYVEKSLTTGTTYIIYISELGTRYNLTTSATLVTSNVSDLIGDVQNPTLSSSSPADNATDVARDANIILNFSESVDVESGSITIKKTIDDSTVETIDVTSGQVTGTGTSQITINPSSDLFGGFEYYVLIDATAFDDSGGNSYAGISSTTDLSFTVADMQDPTTDKDVIGLIDSQSQLAKSFISQSTSTVSGRLNYLRQNRGNDNFSKNNIKQIDSLNKKLDPNYHQAMMEIEDDTKDAGTIIQEIQKGFTIKDRLLRPSLVGVSKKTKKETSKNQENKENLQDK